MSIVYYPELDGLERFGLGPTGAQLMEYLWECRGSRSLMQIHTRCSEGRSVNTTQTILTRLVRKGLLRRVKDGREHYHYSPVEPRAVWEARQLAAIRESLG